MINSRLSVAIHILSLLAAYPHERLTSEFIAQSVNTNPVVVRRISGLLRKKGLIHTRPGTAGAVIARPPDSIRLLDIYEAVFSDNALFSVHENPNPNCPVGKRIQETLDDTFVRVEEAMKTELANQSLQDITEHLFS
ncbi:transcriptional regulator, BadM/Rrf2 family [Alteribacillus persepolensis]|uniref:Transcriptional regulator, BadM/Rrf2 family n=1 Tax=Alteribacillus persepolensis TaxID=568899 RepID=A0A1G8FUW4_9BACI|nr:Rrf2 family transcriptional regulator [Alteribacillus persepolensis]SDH85907.1 transcriptional regulator, BadM/Rrf2 family [Alteribacillus persepolensis]